LYAPGQGRAKHRSLQKISGEKEGGIPRVGFPAPCCSVNCSAPKEREEELQVVRWHTSLPRVSALATVTEKISSANCAQSRFLEAV